MTSMLRIGACTVALAFAAAAPALAQDDTKKPAMHHHMHKGMMHKGHMGKMSKMGSKSEGDAAVAKLNEQSLQQAKEGAAPAGAMTPASGGAMTPASGGAMAPSSGGAMAPASSGSMAPPASTSSMPK